MSINIILICAVAAGFAFLTFRRFSAERETGRIALDLLMSSMASGTPCAELVSGMSGPRHLMGPACVLAETVWRNEAEHLVALLGRGLTMKHAMTVVRKTRAKRLTFFDRRVIRDVARRMHTPPSPFG